jgi:transposase
MKYAIKDFHKQFRNEGDCLEMIYRNKHPEGATCIKCARKDSFYAIEGRRSYSCVCGHQISPTAGTIFHKSPTSLKSWFTAIFLMMASKNGVSAKELERQLGVTYKCAWRMAHQIRQLLKEEGLTLQGTVEADETYIGGVKKGCGRGPVGKTPVFGILERSGSVVAKAVEDASAKSLLPVLEKHVMPQSTIMTDEWPAYQRSIHRDFKHQTVNHRKGEWVRANVHTNSIEGFWSQLKRSIHGTFHHVSRKHLQKYVNEFAYRYNRRKTGIPMFLHALEAVSAKHVAAV